MAAAHIARETATSESENRAAANSSCRDEQMLQNAIASLPSPSFFNCFNRAIGPTFDAASSDDDGVAYWLAEASRSAERRLTRCEGVPAERRASITAAIE